MKIIALIYTDEWEDYIPEPPDGGWGWVVMVASFFNNFILDGIAYCFGVFLEEYIRYFGSSVSNTSLANSLLCGIYLLVGKAEKILYYYMHTTAWEEATRNKRQVDIDVFNYNLRIFLIGTNIHDIHIIYSPVNDTNE